MSDDIQNETMTSFELGYEHGWKAACDTDDESILDRIVVPTAIDEEGDPERYCAGFSEGFRGRHAPLDERECVG